MRSAVVTRTTGLQHCCAIAALAISLLLIPGSAGAYSFLPAGFAPGETITSIELVTPTPGPSLVFDTGANPGDLTDDTLTMSVDVSRITTTLGVYNIPLGTMLASSTLDFVPGTTGNLPIGLGEILVGYANSLVVDLMIFDTLGAEVLFEANYADHLLIDVDEIGGNFGVFGGVDGDMDVVGGNAAFIAAFGTSGAISGVLTGFSTNTNLCALTNNPAICPIGFASDLIDFTVGGATLTIVPNATVPEPNTLVLVAFGFVSMAAFKRR